jgi:hypothetical protein
LTWLDYLTKNLVVLTKLIIFTGSLNFDLIKLIMASYVGAITEYNPYIQQIPDTFVKVGMQKEMQYQAGVAETQQTIDKIAGLDIANEGGRRYLSNRVQELTDNLNKYSQVDFSNRNNVTQLQSLARPLYQDENIVNDVINTGIYRKWSKEAGDAYKSGKMELGQYMRETTDANKWLSSQSAGADYTGRANANTATKKDLLDRVIKAKKDGIEKNEYVYDVNYSIDTPYYVKSTNKYYNEADFNNFISNNVMTTRDREMLMNDHWYENQGKPVEQLQAEDIAQYQYKIDANNAQIGRIKEMPKFMTGDAKMEYQKTIDDLTAYNKQLADGKIKYLQTLDLADPNTADVFHRDLSESRFINSLDILRDETKKEELQKNEQWFKDKEFALELAKNAARAASDGSKKVKTPEEQINEVGVFTPVSPTAPKTEVSLNTIQRGFSIRNDEINNAMNSLIGKMQQNGVNIDEYISGWDQVQVGTKGGASAAVPRFKDEGSKRRFYDMVKGLDFAYSMEANDGNLDNKSFRQWVGKINGYNDNDPNSKFTLADKTLSDALNSIKGTSALLPKLEGLFADKGVVRTLSQIDSAIKDKKDVANVYREALYKSNALSAEEMIRIKSLSDDDLLGGTVHFDAEQEQRRFDQQGLKPVYGIVKEGDGSFSIKQSVVSSDPGGYVKDVFKASIVPEGIYDKILSNTSISQDNKLAGGYQSYKDAQRAWESKNLKIGSGISSETFKKADDFVRKTYSYVQENLNSTVQNLKDDKSAYAAVQDGLTLFLNNSKNQATLEDIAIEGGAIDPKSLTGITKVEVLGASLNNSADIFNPNPVYEVQFTGVVGQGTKEEKSSTYNAKVSMKSFLATNPNYRTSEYAKYFAPAIYGQKDAYARLKATVNPLEGSFGSYGNRENIEPIYQGTTQKGTNQFFNDAQTDIQWETLPLEKEGKQTMISYQVVSLGQNTVLGNKKNKDGNVYAPGAFYVKLKVPTSTGDPKIIFMKKPTGDSYAFNNASDAHYAMRDLIFGNPDVRFDEIDPKSGDVNYFTTDPTTLRGIFNAQLSYNGFSKLESVKIKDALGKEITKQQAKELQFGSR